MKTPKTKTKSNSAEDFIKRKNEYFKKNNIIKVKDIGRKGIRFFFREAWTFMPQSNLNEKVLVIERLRKGGLRAKLLAGLSGKKETLNIGLATTLLEESVGQKAGGFEANFVL